MVNVEMNMITLGKDVAGGQQELCMHRNIVRTGNVYGGTLYMDSGAYVCDVEYKCTNCGDVWTRKEKVN